MRLIRFPYNIFCREFSEFFIEMFDLTSSFQSVVHGNEKVYEAVAPIVKVYLNNFLKEPCREHQNDSINVASLLLPVAAATRYEFKRIWTLVCQNSTDANIVEFCRVIGILKNFSDIGAQKLTHLLSPEVSLNITKQACSKYIDGIENVTRTTLNFYSERIDMKKAGCYIAQLSNVGEIFMKKLEEFGENFRDNSLKVFEEKIKQHRSDIVSFRSNIQKKYQMCLSSRDAKTCLKQVAEVTDIKSF